jgi:hypothetical protein
VEVERAAHQGERRAPGSWKLCYEHLSLGPLYIVGRGVHLAPPPRHLGRQPRERRPRAAAARVGPAGPHLNPNPSPVGPLGPMAP